MKIKFDEIPYYASLYPEEAEQDKGCFEAGEQAKKQGFLTKDQLLVITDWKTQRTKRFPRQNSERLVQATTKAALESRGTKDPIRYLMDLSGVGMPTASCILHYCHQDPYPIIDYRALWTLDIHWSNTSWQAWIRVCWLTDEINRITGYDYRTIDRALWQFSRMHQPVLNRKSKE